ncbi:MAG: L-ribulose-5-phosphate 4-epimerase [Firmicutes bacterium]|nr:L-ribulose-5-phosphate 4-epimerase [Bacillota bacterium]
MLEELKEDVLAANLELYTRGLAIYTWGNVSGIERERGLVVIKPSGVPREELTVESLVVLDLEGKVVEGRRRPSTDTPTHLVLYRAFAGIGGIVHTHSSWATAWAQAGLDLPCLGTTHADHFYGGVPCTRPLTEEEIKGDYEANTGRVIVERFRGLDPLAVPAVLVAQHGPFAWGRDPAEAVRNAVVLEETARMAFITRMGHPSVNPISRALLDKHFLRKHGSGAYYGQLNS